MRNPQEESGDAMPPRILIVDDEPVIRDILSLAFKHAGYVVATAENCHDAITRCGEETFDIVLSDVVMPGMNGHDLVLWLAAHFPGTRTALMSGFDAGADGTNLPPCPFIKKPFLPGEIVTFVQQVLVS